ncbi:hypothetical protein NCC78_05110, partial [Micromonospora phytophila]|nr:hypothetical protein [Micromonospora phytophila]
MSRGPDDRREGRDGRHRDPGDDPTAFLPKVERPEPTPPAPAPSGGWPEPVLPPPSPGPRPPYGTDRSADRRPPVAPPTERSHSE